MTESANRLANRLRRAEVDLAAGLVPRGVVRRVADQIAWASGLEAVGYEDLVAFDSGGIGLALELAPDRTGIVLLTGTSQVRVGEGVRGLDCGPALPAGPGALGRLIDPLGAPLDGGPRLPDGPRPLFAAALELAERQPIDRPLATGVLAVDAAIPIGRGQRELIVGDRDVGKTSLALDIVAAQQTGDVACVYVLVGQSASRVFAVREALERADAAGNTVVIAADASSPAGLQYLAPYAGAAAAEAFRDLGRDALVVYDDLTKHADVYRELALLLGRPPGREAFPGDIFYVHAALLERAAARRPASGGGSVTALPLVETTDSDISAYIPTNLISITDGQIYLDAARHERNERPAIDIGRSVSRIGGKAQRDSMRQAARNLRILVSRFEELEALTRVGLDVDASTARTIRRGRVLRELLRQPRFANRPLADQILTLTAVTDGWLDEAVPARARVLIGKAIEQARTAHPDWFEALAAGRPLGDDEPTAFHALVEAAVKQEPRATDSA